MTFISSMYLQEELEDTKGVIRISITPRQKTQWKKDKTTNKDLQNTTQKTKDRSTRNPLQCNTRVNPDAPKG